MDNKAKVLYNTAIDPEICTIASGGVMATTEMSEKEFGRHIDAAKRYFLEHLWFAEDEEMTIGRAVGDYIQVARLPKEVIPAIVASLMEDPDLVAESRRRAAHLDPACA